MTTAYTAIAQRRAVITRHAGSVRDGRDIQYVYCIQSATGENLTEAAQIADRWKGYCEDLYCDEEGKGIEREYWEKEPPPLRSEVARAIRQTASRKATGPDEVPAELFKAGRETVLDRMHRICVAIWKTGEWPEEWTFSTFIPLPKKNLVSNCLKMC